jgi:hypothetical protein
MFKKRKHFSLLSSKKLNSAGSQTILFGCMLTDFGNSGRQPIIMFFSKLAAESGAAVAQAV